MRFAYPPQLVTPPTGAPVSLEEAKRYLRVEFSDDDTIITSLIEVATAHFDGWRGVLNRCLIEQTWRQTFDGFGPSVVVLQNTADWQESIRLRLALPALSITSIAYLDSSGASQTVDAEDYVLRSDMGGSFVEPVFGGSWPTCNAAPQNVTVNFVAGYGKAEDVPAPLRTAILIVLARLYDRRDSLDKNGLAELPHGLASMIEPYRIYL